LTPVTTCCINACVSTPEGGDFALNPKQLEFRPLEVSVQENDVGRALSALKRKMANEGLYKELKKRRFHEKPSVSKKRKQREAERRRKKLHSHGR